MPSTSLPEHQQLTLPLDEAPEAALPDRLFRLGLAPGTLVTLTRNRTVLLTQDPRKGLRLHAGFAWAPDEVLRSIIQFIAPRVPRAVRLVARRRFMAFPVERHVASHQARPRERSIPPADLPLVTELMRMHEILNARHFAGALRDIPIRVSSKMSTRLGEFRADHHGQTSEIAIARRHLRRDGWASVTDTLLHEMIHQWQHETGLPLDHGGGFRRKARELGIHAAARVPDYLIR